MCYVFMLLLASVKDFLSDKRVIRRSDLVICRTDCPAGEAPALQIISESSLRAFFESRGFAAQMGKNLAGEME